MCSLKVNYGKRSMVKGGRSSSKTRTMLVFFSLFLSALFVPGILSGNARAETHSDGETTSDIGYVGTADKNVTGMYILQSNNSHIVIEAVVNPDDLVIEEVQVNGTIYHNISLLDYGFTAEVGSPKLPVMRAFVAVPYGAEITTTILLSTESIRYGYNVYPVPANVVSPETGEEPITIMTQVFTKNETIYSTDAFYPAEATDIGLDGYIRGYRVIQLEFQSIQFNPVSNELKIYDSVELELDYGGTFAPVGDLTSVSYFDSVLESTILNYEINKDWGTAETMNTGPGNVTYETDLLNPSHSADYLIITNDTFALNTNLTELAYWRAEHNYFDVAIVNTSDIYGQFPDPSNNCSIREFLNFTYYNSSWGCPAYVLLVGDADYLPTHVFYGEYASDNWFVCLNGTDTKPDMFIGRFSVNNNTEADTMCNKTVMYEKEPLWGDWRKNVTMISGEPGGAVRFEITSEEICNNYVPYYFDVNKVYYLNGDDPEDIKTNINNGQVLVNYIDHGNVNWWWGGGFSTSDFSNGRMLPVVLSSACSTGNFDYPTQDCMAEVFLKTQTGGAVSFIGATTTSYASYVCLISKLLTKCLFVEGNREMGSVLSYAKYNLADDYESNIYTLFGDPAMHIALPSSNLNVTPEPKFLECNTTLYVNGTVRNDFNGSASVTLYDSLNNSFQSCVVDVIDGKFETSFLIPSWAHYGEGIVESYVWNETLKEDYLNDTSFTIIPQDTFVSRDDIQFSNPNPTANETITINATIHKSGNFTQTENVSFYDGDPDIGGTWIGSQMITLSTDGEVAVVAFMWNSSFEGAHNIFVVVSNQTCPEPVSNNRADRVIYVGWVNVVITEYNIKFNPRWPKVCCDVVIGATILNTGEVDATDVTIQFFDGDPDNNGILIGTFSPVYVAKDGEAYVECTWRPTLTGEQRIYVNLSSLAEPESWTSDNIASRKIYVREYWEEVITTFAGGYDNATLNFDAAGYQNETISLPADAYVSYAIMDITGDKRPWNEIAGSLYANVPGTSYGMAFDSNDDLYISDYGNDQILKYNISGPSWDLYVDTSANVKNPRDITFDSDDNLYVHNGTVNTSVWKCNATTKDWSVYIDLTGEDLALRGIATNSKNEMAIGLEDMSGGGGAFLLALYNDSIGEFVADVEIGYTPYGLAHDGRDYLYVANMLYRKIYEYEAIYAGVVGADMNVPMAADAEPVDEAFNNSGVAFILDTFDSSIRKYDPRYPQSPGLDVGADGVDEWLYIGNFNRTETTLNFSEEINDYLIDHQADADAKGNITIPLAFYSNSSGKITVPEIGIVYSFGRLIYNQSGNKSHEFRFPKDAYVTNATMNITGSKVVIDSTDYYPTNITFNIGDPNKYDEWNYTGTLNTTVITDDFAMAINDYIVMHQDDADAEGYITVPSTFYSDSAGTLNVEHHIKLLLPPTVTWMGLVVPWKPPDSSVQIEWQQPDISTLPYFLDVHHYAIYRSTTIDALNYTTPFDTVSYDGNDTHTWIDYGAGENISNFFYVIHAANKWNTTEINKYIYAKCRRTLDEGWNLISIPLIQQDEDILTVLDSIDSKWDYVEYYDAFDETDHWKTYATFKPPSLNDLHYINHSMGFWIYITSACNLTVCGEVPRSVSIPLHEGWNMVSYPSFNKRNIGELFAAMPWDRIETGYITAPYNLQVLTPADNMTTGRGYWVRATENCTWNITNIFAVPLHSGWNLASIPLVRENISLESVLLSVKGSFDYVQYYNATDLEDPWKSYATFKPPSLNDLHYINNEMGFWIRMIKTDTLLVHGIEPLSHLTQLYTGWNMVGYPNLTEVTVAETFSGVPYSYVEEEDITQDNNLRVMNDTDMLRPGEGYWVCVTEDCIWKQGTEGRIIQQNGGEFLGGTVPITWACFIGYPKVDLYYSDNNGTDWYLIASNETDDGFFLWNTTIAPDTTTGLIKIVTETDVIDISDSTFTIDNTAPTASILIDNDAKYVSGEQVYPDPVTLDIFALDNIEGSGAYKYRLKTAQRLSTGGYKESDWTKWFNWPDPASTKFTYENFNLGKGYWSTRWVYLQVKDNAGNIAGEDPAGIENAPGSIYDTIIFLNPNQPIPYIEVLTYQEVNITLRVAGREGDTVTMIVFENDKPIGGLRVTREPGDPEEQSKTLTLRVYTSILSDGTNVTYNTRNYDILLIYNSAGIGANPVKLIFESENNTDIINTSFNSVQGLAQEKWFDIDEILNLTLQGNQEFHFQTIGHSTCHWNLGDGTELIGENVVHTYAGAGTYLVTLTYMDEDGEVIAMVQFEVVT